jgi:hypothetical protein
LNRIGIDPDDLPKALEIIKTILYKSPRAAVTPAASEDLNEQNFALGQIKKFNNLCNQVEKVGL